MKHPDMRSDPFVCANEYIDSTHPDIRERAAMLAHGCRDDEAVTKACFEWVRDEITNSEDEGCAEVPCKASDVLSVRSGFCYAKSHLLAALLRANMIPAGLCYQRLKHVSSRTFGLHGLVAVHILPWGWCRIDPWGSNSGGGKFYSAMDQLMWSGNAPGEFNFSEVWATPMPMVIEAMHTHDTVDVLKTHLPDLEPAANAHAWGHAPVRRLRMAQMH